MGDMPDRRARQAQGAAIRQRVPRAAHARWAAAANRADPVTILGAQGRTRIAELLPTRYARMRVSAFSFYRGAAAIMAADLASLPRTGILVQLCGDAHLANFGSFPSPEGRPLFDVNDFDETLPGPFEWDVKRLAASLAVAGSDAGLGAEACRSLAARAVRHYRRHMGKLARLSPFEVWHSRIDLADAVESLSDETLRRRVKRRLRDALAVTDAQYHLVEQGPAGPRIRDHGTTEHIERFRPAMEAVFEAYRTAAAPPLSALFRHYRLADSAFKVVGVGSVGTFCALGLFVSGDGEELFLQAKEAQDSVLTVGLPLSQFVHQGERVVTGQRLMQAEPDLFLGFPPSKVEGRYFYVRRLKDSRMADIGAAMEADALPFTAALCGRTLARAHARGGDAATIAGYMGESDGFDGPIADFAMAYAAQAVTDWQEFCRALDAGRLGIA
ncbi:MAG TPA: DUF2252 domain-containing protein [Acetobacteraceae bacterium]|nr:DUF2252 domain-containing protein [Acetobacteraceae bacterium]